ncbi:MAG: Gfo/Idh/MocA family oxidoreductase [Tepidisphaeraceae bacterium]|jgi:predicted dehydrogenase
MKIVRWGIIGCGDVTEVKSGPGFQKAEGSQLVAVMRRDGRKAADYAKRHGVPKWHDDAEALIADREVDAVYVATPPGTHEHFALKVCAAGKPCYVEKPMSRNSAEARRMVQAFGAARWPLFVAYYRRAQPRFLKVKEILDSGSLGRIHSVSYRLTNSQMSRREEPVPWRLQAEHSGGGLFLDVGSHALDLLDFFLGPLNVVEASASSGAGQYDVEDRVDMRFSIKGFEGTAHWDFASSENCDEYHFIGERGEMRFACFASEPIVVSVGGKEDRFDIPNPAHVQQPLIQCIVDELRGLRPADQSPSTGITALRTQEVMDAALSEFYGGREDGFWQRSAPLARRNGR